MSDWAFWWTLGGIGAAVVAVGAVVAVWRWRRRFFDVGTLP